MAQLYTLLDAQSLESPNTGVHHFPNYHWHQQHHHFVVFLVSGNSHIFIEVLSQLGEFTSQPIFCLQTPRDSNQN
jgi:hypothetical protein